MFDIHTITKYFNRQKNNYKLQKNNIYSKISKTNKISLNKENNKQQFNKKFNEYINRFINFLQEAARGCLLPMNTVSYTRHETEAYLFSKTCDNRN